MVNQRETEDQNEDKLAEIVQELVDADKKVQLIYAFNGTGKTRLSRSFKRHPDVISEEGSELTERKILYYSAFTEDLFAWDNDEVRKINIQPNVFTDWILGFQGDERIIKNFQSYTDERLTPSFPPTTEQFTNSMGRRENRTTYPEVRFSFRGEDEIKPDIKISKGEESNFVWSMFYSLLEEVQEVLGEPNEELRDSDQFNKLRYIFVDDPVSSLDDNHLIQLAVDLAKLIKSHETELKFIITTHNPLFFNVLQKEFQQPYEKLDANGQNKRIYSGGKAKFYRLDKSMDGTYSLFQLDRKTPFSYHLTLLKELEDARQTGQFTKYHFNFLRNILEKTATFLGHEKWENLLPKGADGNPDPFASRILNLSSHSAHAGDELAEIQEGDKEKMIELINFLNETYHFKRRENQNA